MDAYEDDDPQHGDEARPVVRRAGGQQMVHAAVVAAAIIDALASLDLHYPKVGKAKLKELAAARKVLMAEKS